MDLLDGPCIDARLRKVARPAFAPQTVRCARELVEQALARDVRSVRPGTTIGAVLAWSARHPGRLRRAGAELDVFLDRLLAELQALPREDMLSSPAPAAVEEALRYGSPAQSTDRWARWDTEVAGTGEHPSCSPGARSCSGAPPARSKGGTALQAPAARAPGSVAVAPRRHRTLTARGLSDLPVKVGVR